MAHTIETYGHQLFIEHNTVEKYLERVKGIERKVGETVLLCSAFVVDADSILEHRNKPKVGLEKLDQMLKEFSHTRLHTLKEVEKILNHVPDGLEVIEIASRRVNIELKMGQIKLPERLKMIHTNANRRVRVTRNDRRMINNDTRKISQHLSKAISYLNDVISRDVKQARKEDNFRQDTVGKEFNNLSHARGLIEWAEEALKKELEHILVLESHVKEVATLIEDEIKGVTIWSQRAA